MTVTLYHVAGNPHSQTMLMAHLPKQRLLIEVDAFTPGSAVSPYSPNLLENVRKRSLAVDRVVPLHSTIAPFSQLEAVASGGTARQASAPAGEAGGQFGSTQSSGKRAKTSEYSRPLS